MIYRGLIWGSGFEIREVGAQSSDRGFVFRFHLGIGVCYISEVSLGVRAMTGSLTGSVYRSNRQGLYSRLMGQVVMEPLGICSEVISDAGVKGVSWSYHMVSVPGLRTLLTTAVRIWNPQGAGPVGGSDPPRDGRGWLGRAAATSGHGLH